MDDQQKLYGELSWLWPIISPLNYYTEESLDIASWIKQCAPIKPKNLLNLGCGGGHHDYILKEYFSITGVDLSETMIDLAQNLNPEVVYHVGDLLTYQPTKTYDVVLVIEAVDHVQSESDLKELFKNIYKMLNPGGICLTYRNVRKEDFVQNSTTATPYKSGDTEVVLIENRYDPDPDDTTCELSYIYLVRQNGKLTTLTDQHICGLFNTDCWLKTISDAGFKLKQRTINEIPMTMGIKPL